MSFLRIPQKLQPEEVQSLEPRSQQQEKREEQRELRIPRPEEREEQLEPMILRLGEKVEPQGRRVRLIPAELGLMQQEANLPPLLVGEEREEIVRVERVAGLSLSQAEEGV